MTNFHSRSAGAVMANLFARYYNIRAYLKVWNVNYHLHGALKYYAKAGNIDEAEKCLAAIKMMRWESIVRYEKVPNTGE